MVRFYAASDNERKPAILTPWSLVHVAAGAASKSYTGFWSAELAHLIYELVGSKRVFNLVGFNVTEKSSFINSVSDQGAFTIGRMLNKSTKWTAITLALAVSFTVLGIEF